MNPTPQQPKAYIPFIATASRKLFAVFVEGNCMEDPDDPQHSIYDGNYVIVDPQTPATAGDVVLARIDGDYSTIKRFFPGKEKIELIPDNPAYSPLVYPKTRVEIIGKVVYVCADVKSTKEQPPQAENS